MNTKPVNVRFTVLTPRMIRCEWQPEGRFEDRPTQWVLNRAFPEVTHNRTDTRDQTVIETDALTLVYQHQPGPFHRSNLSVKLKRAKAITWQYGDANSDNLGGTARTLDECDGPVNRRKGRAIEVHPGLFSRSGWTVLDDTASMVLNAANMPEERGIDRRQDFYFMAYGHDFVAGLRDFYALTGAPPLLPAWSLGLWWSRWEKYKADDLLRIVEEFETHGVPLSTLVIDMDWHIIKNAYHSGWTGYTWNKEFFPDPRAFFETIHARGIRACLNLHPASGVHPHEEAYEDFARFMGIDPASKQLVEFNPTDAKFLEGYFKYLHHPHEKLGVDFWWIDWQQGKKTPFGDIDPLWVLNHLHSADLARDGQRRPFTFSRWCGAGAHRYPVGFSGDTCRTWKSLRYQVEFTARAANLGFGWWSHDIGAFARGIHNEELYLRWVQFGCFSPIFRLHNAGDPTADHRPWSKSATVADATIKTLKLRRALQPYIYTQAKENAEGGFPLIRPMYFHHGEDDESYQWPNQYYFGPDLLAAPVTKSRHPETGLVTQPVWLPEGSWCDFFAGTTFAGGRVHAVQADLETIPVYAKAGAIIPTTDTENGTTALICFPGAAGGGELYVDDGTSLAYQSGHYARYRFTQTTCDGRWTFKVERAGGDLAHSLTLSLVFRGYENLVLTGLRRNQDQHDLSLGMNEQGDAVLSIGQVGAEGLTLEGQFRGTIKSKVKPTYEGCRRLMMTMPMNCHFARPVLDHWEETSTKPASLARYTTDLTDEQIKVLVNYLFDAGMAVMTVDDRKRHLVWWNNSGHDLTWRFDTRQEYIWESHASPDGQPFGSLAFSCWSVFLSWRLQTDLLGAATIIERENDDRDVLGE